MKKGRNKMEISISLIFALQLQAKRRNVRLNESISVEYVWRRTTNVRLVSGKVHFSNTP